MKLLICCELFNFFAVKLKLLKKSSSFLLLRVTLTSYVVLAMKKSNKFQCVQATKIIKPKHVKDQISRMVTTNFCGFLKF